jgi:CO/xanthine dehydrogenase Mo-binding subunit
LRQKNATTAKETLPREKHAFSRRHFVKGVGVLVVGFSTRMPGLNALARAAQESLAPEYPTFDLKAVDSFIEIHGDGKVLIKIGKVNNGQGTPTSWAMMAAEELDVPFDRVEVRFGDTAATPDQGGTGASNGVSAVYGPLRQAAATARQALLRLASEKLNVPVTNLAVKDGFISGTGSAQSVTYSELIANKKFDISFSAEAPLKDPSEFRIIGKTVPFRPEIAKLVTGSLEYTQDVRVPGMLHARSIRPPVAGSTLVSFDGFDGGEPAGLVKVVSKGNYVAVVAKTEWQAIQVAHKLKVTWREPSTPVFPAGYEALYDYLAKTPPQAVATPLNVGDVEAALASATGTVTATYQSSFQSHASLTPGCCIAEVKDGGATVWFGGQKPYRVRNAIADFLGIPSSRIRVIFYQGAGSYGTNDTDDVAAEAAWISQQLGQPVRLQWMRDEGIAWDPKAPPHLTTMRAGIDSSGKVVAWDYNARMLSGTQRAAGALIAGDILIGQTMGYEPRNESEHGVPADNYHFPNARRISNVIPSKWAYQTGLRTAHMRDPNGPQVTFASEQFIDEVAAALKLDPIEFRLAHLDPVVASRDINVIEQVRKASNWISRPSPQTGAPAGEVVHGRGFAYQPRGGTYVATVAEVTVNRKNGQVSVTKFTTGQDCGLVVHHKNVLNAIEANLIQSMSRALHEGVQFDSKNVKSVDWLTYPAVDIRDIPEVTAFLVNPDGRSPAGKFVPPSGSGEPATRPTAAAIANAIFDATGVRVRRQPLTPETVLAALQAVGNIV